MKNENIELEQIEIHTFKLIQKVLNCLATSEYIYASGDSIAVRAYTPYKRDLEDVDLIFHSKTDIKDLKEYVSKELPDLEIHQFIELGNSNGFLRTKHKIGFFYHKEHYFIFDFHVGGSVFKGKFGCEVDDIFFETRNTMKVASFGEMENILIPVSSVEEIILFKLRKFKGKDLQDILSLLSMKGKYNLDYIKSRFDTYGKEAILQNVENLQSEIDQNINSWRIHHNGINFSATMKRHLQFNLKQLLD